MKSSDKIDNPFTFTNDEFKPIYEKPLNRSITKDDLESGFSLDVSGAMLSLLMDDEHFLPTSSKGHVLIPSSAVRKYMERLYHSDDDRHQQALNHFFSKPQSEPSMSWKLVRVVSGDAWLEMIVTKSNLPFIDNSAVMQLLSHEGCYRRIDLGHTTLPDQEFWFSTPIRIVPSSWL